MGLDGLDQGVGLDGLLLNWLRAQGVCVSFSYSLWSMSAMYVHACACARVCTLYVFVHSWDYLTKKCQV